MAPVVFRALSFPDFAVYMYNKLKGNKYGGVYQFMIPTVLLRDPELIKMVTVKDFEHFLDHQAPISEEAEPMFGKALFNLKGKQTTAYTVNLPPLNRCKNVSKTQWFNWPVTKINIHVHLTHPAQQNICSVKKKSQLMLYRTIIVVCIQIQIKHIYTLCGQNVGFFFNVKCTVHKATTRL